MFVIKHSVLGVCLLICLLSIYKSNCAPNAEAAPSNATANETVPFAQIEPEIVTSIDQSNLTANAKISSTQTEFETSGVPSNTTYIETVPLTKKDGETVTSTQSSNITAGEDTVSVLTQDGAEIVTSTPKANTNASETVPTLPKEPSVKIESAAATVNLVTDAEYEYRKEYGAQMLSYMNQSVDPCKDFYEFACGNWRHVKAERQTSHKRNNLLDIIYSLGDAVGELLERSSEGLQLDYEAELNLTKNFYQACLTADLYPVKASDDYLNVIKSIGGFPAVDNKWNDSTFSWFNMSAHLTNYGAKGLINEEILPQYPFSPYFRLPELGFEYNVHSDNIKTNQTRGYELNDRRMRSYLSAYGVTDEKANEVIDSIFEFWQEVVKFADRFDGDEEKCLVMSTDFQGNFTDWQNYFEIAWEGKDFGVDEDDCPCDYFYVELDKICVKHKEAVANYLAMKFLYSMDARLTSTRFQNDFCKLHVAAVVPFLIDKLYFEEYFNNEIRSEILTIVEELRKSLRVLLEQADWLDEATRKEALLKESTLLSRIGKFIDTELTERLISEMKNLTFVDDSYEQNNINLIKFHTFMRRYNGIYYEQLPNTTKPLELLRGLQVNAFYYNVDNSINVMAGILHPPAYHKHWPNSLKFGTIGYLIGHELTHGFDTVGSRFDSTGDVHNWWTKKSRSVFAERTTCYVNHYNAYLIPEINRHINGNNTKDENIADSGGLHEALHAYRRYMKELVNDMNEPYSLKNEQMPGLDLSPEQLLYLGFAQLWCAAYEEEHYWEELNDEHTIDKYRVLGAVTNNEDFAEVFNCSLGTKMHPNTNKCVLW